MALRETPGDQRKMIHEKTEVKKSCDTASLTNMEIL
jgi:hypothetical protein